MKALRNSGITVNYILFYVSSATFDFNINQLRTVSGSVIFEEVSFQRT